MSYPWISVSKKNTCFSPPPGSSRDRTHVDRMNDMWRLVVIPPLSVRQHVSVSGRVVVTWFPESDVYSTMMTTRLQASRSRHLVLTRWDFIANINSFPSQDIDPIPQYSTPPTTPLKCENEYIMFTLVAKTAAQAVAGSIVWVFRRLEKPRCREMSARGYALQSIRPKLSFVLIY